MRDTFDERDYFYDRPPRYRQPRPGRVFLYLFFFMLGGLTTIGLTFFVNPALLQALLEEFIAGFGVLARACLGALLWLLLNPPAFMLAVAFVILLLLLGRLRRRGRW